MQTSGDGQTCAPASWDQAGSTALTPFRTQILDEGFLVHLAPIVLLNKLALTLQDNFATQQEFHFLRAIMLQHRLRSKYFKNMNLKFDFSICTDATRKPAWFSEVPFRGCSVFAEVRPPQGKEVTSRQRLLKALT